jgi:hypothetical protein
MEYVKPEAWTAATSVSVSENLQYLYCAIAANSFNDNFLAMTEKLMGANQIDKVSQLKNGTPPTMQVKHPHFHNATL